MSYGWLPKAYDRENEVNGIYLDDNATRSRLEEYRKLYTSIQGYTGRALDLAAGYIPGWHIAPEILSKEGWEVVAVDRQVGNFAADPKINRLLADVNGLSGLGAFNLIICISVLEEIGMDMRHAFLATAARHSIPGTLLFITADGYPPEDLSTLIASYGYDVGTRDDDPIERCAQDVSYVSGVFTG